MIPASEERGINSGTELRVTGALQLVMQDGDLLTGVRRRPASAKLIRGFFLIIVKPKIGFYLLVKVCRPITWQTYLHVSAVESLLLSILQIAPSHRSRNYTFLLALWTSSADSRQLGQLIIILPDHLF